MRPNWPMASTLFSFPLTIRLPFQNPKAQCCLNAAMPQRMPLYMKLGLHHLMLSSASGQPSCTILRSSCKDRLREVRRLRNVCIHTLVFSSHDKFPLCNIFVVAPRG